MSYPVFYAYYPNRTRNNDALYSRADAIAFAWNRNVKGVPVPFTGGKAWRKPLNGAGVSANSRIVTRFADEGEKGKDVRRTVRRLDNLMWRADWTDEGYDVEEASTVAQWFYDNSDDTDSDILPSVYTVGETVVEWPNDEYGYAYDDYDYYPNPYDWEMSGDYPDGYCDYCCGPCEL